MSKGRAYRCDIYLVARQCGVKLIMSRGVV